MTVGHGGGVKVLWRALIVAAILSGLAVWGLYFIKRRDHGPVTLVPASLTVTPTTTPEIPAQRTDSTAETIDTSNFKDRELHYKSIIHQPGPLDSEPPVQCTLLMATYRREKMLPQVLSHYCSRKSIVSRIVVVWNDPVTPSPTSLYQQLRDKCSKKLSFVTTTTNKMTNRFRPQNLDSNDTNQCIFFVDDDLIISWEDMSFGFSVWKRFRQHIVGFEGRTRPYSILKDGRHIYGRVNQTGMLLTPAQGSYAIMLPGFFIHRAYLEMMFDPEMVPPQLLGYVDEVMNCDDILFSMMVTRFLRRANLGWSAGLAVQPEKANRVLHMMSSNSDFKGLIARPDHYSIRSACLDKFVRYLGKDSLALTQMGIKKTTKHPRNFNWNELATGDEISTD